MKRFLVFMLLFGFVSAAQAQMPGSSLLKSIPFLNKSDSGKQEQKTDADAAGTQEKNAPPSEGLGSSILKSIPFFNKPDSSGTQPTGAGGFGSDSSQSGSSSSSSSSSSAGSSDSDIGRYKARLVNVRTPQEFLSAMPPLPADVCGAGNKEKGAYHANLRDFDMALTAEIRRLNQESKKIAKEKEPEMKRHAMARAGISEEDAKKIEDSKKKKMSKEEKQALADKYMQQRTGISLQEARDLKKMDKGAREEWAQSYSAQQKQKAAAGMYDSPSTAEQQRNMELAKKSQELSQLVEKIMARENKIRAPVEEFEKKEVPRAEAMYEAEIIPLLKQMCSGAISGEAELRKCERVEKQFRAAQDRFCAQFGPAYRDALRNMRGNLESLLPDYSRMDRLHDEQMRLSTGIDQTPDLPGRNALLAIQKQIELLDTAYKFNLRNDRE